MSLHELKTWPEFYEAVREGRKCFEVRRDDRGFQVGDELILREWGPEPDAGYSGRELRAWVSFVLSGPAWGVDAGYVVMSLEDVRECDR